MMDHHLQSNKTKLEADILTLIHLVGHFVKLPPASSQVIFLDDPIAENILKGVLLQHIIFHAFIIPSNITTSQPNYVAYYI